MEGIMENLLFMVKPLVSVTNVAYNRRPTHPYPNHCMTEKPLITTDLSTHPFPFHQRWDDQSRMCWAGLYLCGL